MPRRYNPNKLPLGRILERSCVWLGSSLSARIVVQFWLHGSTARQRTINQGSTLPELQYEQVLSNLAMFSENPAALPWHVNLREGTTQLTDSINGGSLIDLGPPAVTQPQVFGSRTAVAQWGMSPVIDATELQLLRVAYRRAFGARKCPLTN